MVMSSPSSSTHNRSAMSGMPNPEVLEKAQRRIYTAEYKLQILQEIDTCSEGQIGAILRREGLYSSHLTTWRRQRQAGQLTIHADRGAAMTSKAVALLLSDLGIPKTHSRPHLSNDNPYSEAQFKTLNYQPQFPKLFGSIEDARTFCQTFFQWYNHDHRHSDIGLLTPAMGSAINSLTI